MFSYYPELELPRKIDDRMRLSFRVRLSVKGLAGRRTCRDRKGNDQQEIAFFVYVRHVCLQWMPRTTIGRRPRTRGSWVNEIEFPRPLVCSEFWPVARPTLCLRLAPACFAFTVRPNIVLGAVLLGWVRRGVSSVNNKSIFTGSLQIDAAPVLLFTSVSIISSI
jgi:hypothetical protein